MLSVTNILMIAVFLGVLIMSFSRFLICLFCLEGAMACLFLGVLGGLNLGVSAAVAFFVSISVAAASLGLALLVRMSRVGEGAVNSPSIGLT